MSISRKMVRLALLAAVLIAIAVAYIALSELGGRDPTAWATLAAVLAVIAAVISAWTGQRVIELQEEALEPNLVTSIDVRSRYSLAQFRLSNRGGSAAYSVKLEWRNALNDSEGKLVEIGNGGELQILNPGDSASVVLGASSKWFSIFSDTTSSGVITFLNSLGERREVSFIVSAEHERRALLHDDEEPKTHFELQKIPKALMEMRDEINKTSKQIARIADSRESDPKT